VTLAYTDKAVYSVNGVQCTPLCSRLLGDYIFSFSELLYLRGGT